MPESHTQRGFGIYAEFTDYYGHDIRVQQSSLATQDCVWIFSEVGRDESNHPHLTIEQATVLRDALTEWLIDVKR